MAVTYTDLLRLGKPDPGTEDGTWGDVLNSQVIELLEDAVAGAATVSSWSGNAASLTAANGIPDQSRAAMLVLTGTLTAQGTLTVPAKNKVYAIRNNTNFPVAVVPAGGSGVVVPVGLFTMVHVLGTTAVGGNALTATQLQTARTIGGVSFNGTANINLPGVNTAGNQSTTGNAATATKLQTARTIGGVSFDGSANINLPGVNTAGNQNTTGSAAKLTTARTIALSGDVTGSVSFDGSANATITAVVVDDSHNHVISNVDGLQTALDGKLSTTGGTLTGNLNFSNSGTTKRGIQGTSADNDYWFIGGGGTGANAGYLEIATGDDGQTAGSAEPIYVSQYGPGSPLTGTLYRRATLLDANGNTSFPGSMTLAGNTVWHTGNDGAGSGLDADLLDGLHASSFLSTTGTATASMKVVIPDTRAVNDQPQGKQARAITADFKSNTAVGNPPVTASADYSHVMTIAGWSTNEGTGGWPTQLSVGTGGIAYRQATSATTWGSWAKLWHSGNDGAGSGLDADLLDGLHASSFAATNATATVSGGIKARLDGTSLYLTTNGTNP